MASEYKKLNINGATIFVSDNGKIKRNSLDEDCARLVTDKDGYKEIISVKNGKTTKKKVHRLVAECFCDGHSSERNEVDHIDGCKSNNVSSNLRWVTRRENNIGFKTKRKDASSKYRGVSRTGRKKPWGAFITIHGKAHNLGRFYEERDAAMAWNDAARKNGYSEVALNV